MFPSAPVTPVRLPRWPFAALVVLLILGAWLLDTRLPPPWPDAATPWFEQVRATTPASWTLDEVNAHTSLTPDLPAASLVVLLGLTTCTLATLLATEVPASLALAVALGLGATRTLWSTVSTGQDALPVAVVAATVLGLARFTSAGRVWLAATAAGVALVPSAAWGVAPAAAALVPSRRRRWIVAAALIGLSACVQVVLLRHAWGRINCLVPGDWLGAVLDVLRPGRSADASAWLALRQTISVVTGDVHAFGLAVAALGLARASRHARRLRPASLAALAGGVLATATGLLPPSLVAALLLPWWAVWFGQGLAVLLEEATGPARPVAVAFGILVAIAPPLLRHAAVAPAPWTSGMMTVTRAVSQSWAGALVASDNAGVTRRLRLAGAATVPADALTLDLCIASGRPVYAIGSTVQRVEYLGHRITERPLHAPLAAILRDLRRDQLVALALAPGAAAWAGPEALSALGRLSLRREALVGGPAVGLIARSDRGGDVRIGRGGVDLSLRIGDLVAGRPLVAPLSVASHEADVDVDSAPERLASSRHAAIAVFDREQAVTLRAVGQPAAGLPVSLLRHASWRQVAVGGTSACVAASRSWTTVPTRVRRLSVPTAGASPSRPVLLYLASTSRPAVGVTGLPAHPLWPAWSADVFDARIPEQAGRLHMLEEQDRVPAALRARSPWVARIVVEPRGAWDANRVAVSAGVAPEAWLVRVAAEGHRPETSAVCPLAAPGDRLLSGQYGLLDEDSDREFALWAADGWHPAERSREDVFQWSARPVATVTFDLVAPAPIVLALDATGAAAGTGPQPVVVRLNGRVLRADWQGAGRIDVPADAVRAGENVLALEVGQVVQPAHDTRELGVLVRQLRVIGPERR